MQVQPNSQFILVSPFVAAQAQFLMKYQMAIPIRISARRILFCYHRKVLANRFDVKVVMEAIEPFKKAKKDILRSKQLNLKF